MRRAGRLLVVVLGTAASSVALQGCVTTSGQPGVAGATATEQAIGQCAASLIISAGVGALIGAAIGGSDSAGTGALVGAAVGAGACAVLLQVADEEDKRQIREAERAAVLANASRSKTIRTKSGKTAQISTKVTSAPIPRAAPADAGATTAVASTAPPPAFTNCRYSEQTISVDGQSAGGGKQLWCRLDTGDWQPIKS
jgi:hypothetical protein